MKDLAINIALPLQQFNLKVKVDISLTAITAVFGYSGAGKTSLLRCIAGLEKSAQGTILCNNSVWLQTKNTANKAISEPSTFVPAHQRNVSMVFQDNRLFEHLNVEKNLAYALKRKRNSRINYDEVIALTNIKHLLTQFPSTLSGGEQQRVAIARSILNEPSLLLLDEPFSALDSKHKANLISLLQKIHQQYQLPMVYVSHSVDDIQQLADTTLVLNKGLVTLFDQTHHVIHQLGEDNMIKQQTCLTLTVNSDETSQVSDYGLVALSLDKNTRQVIYVAKENIKLREQHLLSCYINASDISLSLTSSLDSSIMNQLAATIKEVHIFDQKALIKLDSYNHTFYTLISLFSLKKLNLVKHLKQCDQNRIINQYISCHQLARSKVYIQFKASSVKTLSESLNV